jgi:hypothetical protein
MIPDPNSLTWQSLHAYIERRITGVLETLALIQRNFPADDRAQMSVTWERQLEMLQWCLPLVREMQNRENLQGVCPILSLDAIRLKCRSQDNQARASDFARIAPVASNRYTLVRVGRNPSQTADILWSFEGETSEIVEKVETLANEICAQQTQ